MSKKEERLNPVPTEQIAEVASYQEVRERYNTFRQNNPVFFKHLDALQEELNQKLQDAEKAVRAKGVSCGDFELYQFHTKYNAEELLQAVGRDKFLQVGGEMTTKTVYSLDKARIDAAIASNEIPAAAVPRIRTKEPRYHIPEGLVIP